MPYTGSPDTDDTDAVRALVGDKNPIAPLLDDKEYARYLAMEGGNIERAAGLAAKALAAKYAQQADKQTGNFRESLSQIAKSYRDQADSLMGGGSGGGSDPASTTRALPLAGGITDSVGNPIPNFFTRDTP